MSLKSETFKFAAIVLAERTQRYVSVDGKRPTNERMDCDIEMWDMAEDVLRFSGIREIKEVPPKRKKATK